MRKQIAEEVMFTLSSPPYDIQVQNDAEVVECDLCHKKSYRWFQEEEDFLGDHPNRFLRQVFGTKPWVGHNWTSSLDFCKECSPKMTPWFWRIADVCLLFAEVNKLDRAIKQRINHGHQNYRSA